MINLPDQEVTNYCKALDEELRKLGISTYRIQPNLDFIWVRDANLNKTTTDFYISPDEDKPNGAWVVMNDDNDTESSVPKWNAQEIAKSIKEALSNPVTASWTDLSDDNQNNFQTEWERYDDDELDELVIDLIEDQFGRNYTVGVSTHGFSIEFENVKGSLSELKKRCTKLGDALIKAEKKGQVLNETLVKKLWRGL